MVTVALEMHVIMQGGAHPQLDGACHPLSLATGAGHPAPRVLVHLHFPPLCSLPCACALAPLELRWCGLGLSPTRAGEGRDAGCSHPFPVELVADDGSEGAARWWELRAGHKWAIGGTGPLGWMRCTPPVSWPGKLQAEKAERSPNSSPLAAFLRWKQQLEATNIERDFCPKRQEEGGEAPEMGPLR